MIKKKRKELPEKQPARYVSIFMFKIGKSRAFNEGIKNSSPLL
jgi:hypothetical protein